jgi:hypothetical protein
MDDDKALGRILRRFITENEPGYDSPPYFAVLSDRITLDGQVSITPEEHELLRKILTES